MKRVNNIFSKITDMDNLRLAHQNARRGKTHYAEVKQVDNYEDHYLRRLQSMLLQKTFRNSPYKTFTKVERGKTRHIYKLPYFPDRILHHAILQVLEPIWKKVLIRDTYQSIKGRGVHLAMKRVIAGICELRSCNKKIYCLKIDVKKFYPSIDNIILKLIVRKKVKDADVLWLLDTIIDSTQGVPIGNYLSQYLGNLYLCGLDHWVKEKMRIKQYYRYCDDIVILHGDKDFLQYLLVKIEYYLESKLKLKLKENYQVFPLHKRRLDFLGFRFDTHKVFLRKSIAKSFKRRVSQMSHLRNPQNAIMSYYGWIKASSSYTLWDKYITKEIKQLIKQKQDESTIRQLAASN